MILENFERFTDGGKSFVPKISIRKRGQIGFNGGAYKKFGLDNKEYAILFMSKDHKQVAIRFTNDQTEDGLIKLIKKHGNCFVSGKTFLDFHEIDYDNLAKKSFPAEWYPNEQVAVINIADAVKKEEETAG